MLGYTGEAFGWRFVFRQQLACSAWPAMLSDTERSFSSYKLCHQSISQLLFSSKNNQSWITDRKTNSRLQLHNTEECFSQSEIVVTAAPTLTFLQILGSSQTGTFLGEVNTSLEQCLEHSSSVGKVAKCGYCLTSAMLKQYCWQSVTPVGVGK